MTYRNLTTRLAAVSSALVLTSIMPAFAQLNMAQKHPTATGVAAGVGVHAALKRDAAYKKAHGRKLNFADKHPTMSALAAGVATHHYLKKSAAQKKAVMAAHHP